MRNERTRINFVRVDYESVCLTLTCSSRAWRKSQSWLIEKTWRCVVWHHYQQCHTVFQTNTYLKHPRSFFFDHRGDTQMCTFQSQSKRQLCHKTEWEETAQENRLLHVEYIGPNAIEFPRKNSPRGMDSFRGVCGRGGLGLCTSAAKSSGLKERRWYH